ncbi:glutamate synthase central domain-containing protein [Blastococcus brunescens]|uniref:Glutamate synthase central domain-containing protein n=1 Tax=Blastococcus brunescens TaxID=1564165 RepID=A0ABZ1BA63_9ACTN|nr:glutamate synthase central domain-containing protein [Blastococcus sp. BMG 8361]WRL66953.1 glutamate synthase central domain-containing protein [Blastococcus sp. BMG 8361]
MAASGAEPIGSMGTDTPVAALSDRSRLLYDYFGQLFAQVTNPPLDAIREELVTSLGRTFGPEQNLLQATPASCRQVTVPFPVIDNDELAKILHIDDDGDLPGYAAVRITGHFDVNGGERRSPRRSSSCGPRSARRSRPAPGSSCCPTATATRSARPSRRCS